MAGSRAHLVIHGRVQGVGFRHNARAVATRLHLTGWVKNLPSGDVEALAEGPTENLKSFIDWCRNGPEHAQVESLEQDVSTGTGEFSTFAIEP